MRLTRGFTFLAAASLAAGTLIAVTVPHALAAADSDDNVSPANTTVTGSSPASGAGEFTAMGIIDGLPITVKCKSSTLTSKTPARGLGPITVKPTFTSCKDSGGGTDTVIIHGVWTLSFVDAANDETRELSGDKLKLTIPKGGATFSSTLLAGCTVTIAPAAPFTLSSKYDDVSKVTENANLPVSGTGCSTTATTHTTATYTLTPGIHDVS